MADTQLSTSVESELQFGKLYERAAAEVYLEHKFPGAQLHAFGKYAHIDFAVTLDGEVLFFLEVKRRRKLSTDFETTILNWDKHDAGRFSPKYFGVRAYALLVFEDTVLVADITNPPDDRSYRKRGDRNTKATPHAEYLNENMEAHPELLEPIERRREAYEAAHRMGVDGENVAQVFDALGFYPKVPNEVVQPVLEPQPTVAELMRAAEIHGHSKHVIASCAKCRSLVAANRREEASVQMTQSPPIQEESWVVEVNSATAKALVSVLQTLADENEASSPE